MVVFMIHGARGGGMEIIQYLTVWDKNNKTKVLSFSWLISEIRRVEVDKLSCYFLFLTFVGTSFFPHTPCW